MITEENQMPKGISLFVLKLESLFGFKMDIQSRLSTTTSSPFTLSSHHTFLSRLQKQSSSPSSSGSSYWPLKPLCSKRNSSEPKQNGDENDKFSTDWDKAWSNFKKQGKKTLFSQFSPNKYVSWNPKSTKYPLSEEVDPIKRTERSNLELWTSPRFTLAGAIVIVTFLLIYTILSPV